MTWAATILNNNIESIGENTYLFDSKNKSDSGHMCSEKQTIIY